MSEFTDPIFKGRIWYGIPLINLPVSRVRVLAPRDIKQHRIPGRDGDIVDDLGSPSRRVIIEGEISQGLLDNIKDRPIPLEIPGVRQFFLASPMNFFAMLYLWWSSRAILPFLSIPMTTLMKIADQGLDWRGGRGGRFEYRLELVEKLPFSLGSIIGQALFFSLWGATGFGGTI